MRGTMLDRTESGSWFDRLTTSGALPLGAVLAAVTDSFGLCLSSLGCARDAPDPVEASKDEFVSIARAIVVRSCSNSPPRILSTPIERSQSALSGAYSP